jgi:hypothetical protein
MTEQWKYETSAWRNRTSCWMPESNSIHCNWNEPWDDQILTCSSCRQLWLTRVTPPHLPTWVYACWSWEKGSKLCSPLSNAKSCVLVGPRHGTARAQVSACSRCVHMYTYSSHYIKLSLAMNLIWLSLHLYWWNDLTGIILVYRSMVQQLLRSRKRWSLNPANDEIKEALRTARSRSC